MQSLSSLPATSTQSSFFRINIHLLVFLSGLSALSWEVIWQIKSTLALGVSAWGTALTLATTMGGMSLGAILAGNLLKNKTIRPVRLYGIFEIIIGLSGLLLITAFQSVERLDTWVYGAVPNHAVTIHLAAIIAVLGIPTMCLGATLPVIGLAARQHQTSLALLYGLNTLGAAVGVLVAAFLLIPLLGVSGTICAIAATNIAVGITAFAIDKGAYRPEKTEQRRQKTSHANGLEGITPFMALLTVFVTGFATFTLEVAWFRSLISAFLSTTDAFTIMLAAVLIALGIGARLVGLLQKRNISLGTIVSWAGILILLATPLVERFDIVRLHSEYPAITVFYWFCITIYVIGFPVLLLGIALPWILEGHHSTRLWGKLYSLNAIASVLGALCAGWILLPAFGFARTAWISGILVLLTGLLLLPQQRKFFFAALGTAALLTAVIFESGVGRLRIQGQSQHVRTNGKILAFQEGPDATVSVLEYKNGERTLIINGFVTTTEIESGKNARFLHYMAWMGHMPMLLHPDPKNALVICFGTGQTAHAVRSENPEHLDIVDLSKRVLEMAPLFASNHSVLDDPRVTAKVMDGRAYLRRTKKVYDVITLEPMPPHFSGVNALYSREFYQLARERMSEKGVIAQWMPFHLMSTQAAASIAKTFQDVFPNAALWIDPLSTTGILLGSMDESAELNRDLPGLKRADIERDLSGDEIRKAFILTPDAMRYYGSFGKIINDNNQLLSYGKAVHMSHRHYALLETENHDLLKYVLQSTKEGEKGR